MMMIYLLLITFVFADTCTGNVKEDCSGCLDGYSVLVDNKCVTPQSQMQGCLKYDVTNKKCLECTSFYYLKDNKCEKVPEENKDCVIYSAETNKCTGCVYQKGVDANGTCVDCENDEAICSYKEEYNNTFYECIGHFEENECKEFKTSVEHCNYQVEQRLGNGTINGGCMKCEEGYSQFYKNESYFTCVENKVDNCEVVKSDDENSCVTCKKGYKLENSTCILVKEINNCTEVDSEKGLCNKCQDGFKKSDDETRCVPENLEHCILYEDRNGTYVCTNCEMYYGIKEDGTCGKCDSHCQLCAADLKTCYVCETDYDNSEIYLLDDTECVKYLSKGLEQWEKLLILISIIIFVLIIVIIVVVIIICCVCKRKNKNYNPIN